MEIQDDYQVLMSMADEYSKNGEELAKIKNEKSTALLVLMTEEKSCKAAEMVWQATEAGKRETTLTFLLKGLEKKMAALRTKINASKPY